MRIPILLRSMTITGGGTPSPFLKALCLCVATLCCALLSCQPPYSTMAPFSLSRCSHSHKGAGEFASLSVQPHEAGVTAVVSICNRSNAEMVLAKQDLPAIIKSTGKKKVISHVFDFVTNGGPGVKYKSAHGECVTFSGRRLAVGECLTFDLELTESYSFEKHTGYNVSYRFRLPNGLSRESNVAFFRLE